MHKYSLIIELASLLKKPITTDTTFKTQLQTDVDYLTRYAAAAGNADEKLRVLSEAQGAASDAMLEYATSEKMATEGVDGYINQQIVARQSTLKFGDAIKAVGKKLVMMGANMVVMFAISKALQIAVNAWDDYIHRVEKAKEALETSQDAFNTVTGEIESLSTQLQECQDKITEINALGGAKVAKDGELERLQQQTTELENQLALKREESRLAAIELAKDAEKAYNVNVDSNYFYDSNAGFGAVSSLVSPAEELNEAIRRYRLYAEEKKQIDKDLEASQQKLYQAQESDIDTSALVKEVSELQAKSDQYQISMDDASRRAKEMADISVKVEEAYSSILESGGALSEQRKIDLAIINALNNGYYAFLKTITSVESAMGAVESISSGSETKNPVFNITDEAVAKKIDDYQSRLSSLASALDKVKDKSLTGSDLLDLQQEFPSLINTTDKLDVALTKLVDDTLTKVVDYLKTSGAPNGLILSFQELANEAKGLSFDSWVESFDVFDTAYNEMKTLAEMVKALGSSYTLTAAEARKFSEVFPDLLLQGQITTDGLVQFNSQVIDAFVKGKKTEIQADKDSQIAKLENQKAVIQGQMAVAQAELALIEAQGNAEIDAENQTGEAVAEARDNLVQHLVDLGVEEGNADAAVKELMAGNVEEYDRVVSEVSQNTHQNLSDSVSGAATNVGISAKSMIESLFSVGKQAVATAKSILSIGTGNPIEAVKEKITGASEAIKDFKPQEIIADFQKKITEDIAVDKFEKTTRQVKLELDISNYQKSLDNIDAQINLLKSGGEDLDKYLDDKGSGGSGKGSESSEKKEVDWIERKLQLLEQKRSLLESKSSSPYLSYLGLDEKSVSNAQELFDRLNNGIGLTSDEFGTLINMASQASMSMTEFYDALQDGGAESRGGYLSSLLETDTVLLNEYGAAAEHYKQEYENSLDGLSDEIRQKIELGGDDISDYTGDESEKIQTAIDARDKYLDTLQKETEQKEQLIETTKRYYENEIAYLDAQAARVEHNNSMLNAQIDYLITAGQVVNASSYESLIANLRRQEEIINQKLKKRKAELKALMDAGDVKEGSEDYYTLIGYIEECESSLIDLSTQQEEYNNKLLQMPIDNMDTLISMYESITNTIQNWGNEVEAAGKKLDSAFYQSLIDNGMTLIHQYEEQADKIRDVMDEYEVGSEKWNELYAKLQSINSEMSSMIANLHEWNQKLLEMPLSSISSQIEGLQSVLEGLTSLQDDYDTVITAVTGAIAKQIKVLNDEKDAINDEYQSRMDTLQERLDLLNKQNEALQLQTDYEQALYDLQTANTQKTERVIRNGEVVYERNADNLRNAQEKVQDSLAALEEYKIQSEIDDLNDELEKINKRYDEQIEKLEKISEKWSQIKSDVEDIQNGAVADEYLGAGWKDKVLAEDDADIYAAFKGNYETNAALIKQYETQIQTTQNIYDLLNSYIVAYKEGTLSYEQTVKGIQGILSQMNQDMTSGKNVQNILDFLAQANGSEATASSVLEGIQSSLTKSSDELIKSLEQYNENLALIADCTTSWEALTENVKGIRDILEEVRDNLEDAIDNYNEHSKKEEDVWDDEDEWRSSGVVGPGDTANDHYTGGGGYVDSGPGVYADGIKKGLVGTSDPHKTGEQIKLLATEDLAPDAVPVIAHRYEAILNQPQQQKLLENFEKARYTPVLNLPKLNMANTMPPSNGNIVINMGDIKLTDVRDVDGFAKAMAANFESSMRQALGRMR